MNDNVVDLRQRLATDKRAGGFLNSIRALACVAELLGTTISMMGEADQRFLCQIIAWRMMGGMIMPASESIVHFPLLTGMGFDGIVAAAERLADNDVIQRVIVRADKAGNPIEMGFRWPALEKLIAQGDEIARGPQIRDLSGRAIFTPPDPQA